MSEIFISYSRGDSNFVDRLISDLEGKGHAVWVDRQDIEGGSAWRASISEAIRECRAFVLVLSPNSTQSKNVSRELSLAETHDRTIIPIVYQNCDIPPGMEYQLAELQWINLNIMSYEEGIERLVRVLHKLSEAAQTTAPTASVEKRRNDTARLREILETAAAKSETDEAQPPQVVNEPVTPSQPRDEPTHSAPPQITPPTTLETATAGVAPGIATAPAKSSRMKLILIILGVIAALFIGVIFLVAVSATDDQPTDESTSSHLDSSPANGSPNTAAESASKHEAANSNPANEAANSEAVPIIANSRTFKYHKKGCPGYYRIPDRIKVEFQSAAEAEAAGYVLSSDCDDETIRITTEYPVMGNSKLNIFHKLGCPGYFRVPEDCQIPFKSVAEAEEKGYKQADNCN